MKRYSYAFREISGSSVYFIDSEKTFKDKVELIEGEKQILE
jgi:hypothetical protein